jgi:hemoglobin/transferrin/lactoferrin receptor protein
MKFKLILFITCCVFNLYGQVLDSALQVVPIQETVISANRSSENRGSVAQQTAILSKTQIEQLNAQSTADLLTVSGQTFVQKSQQGGGSPVLRGFEANRVLLVMDGVRMNNAIYRAGHLQNVVTIDQGSLDRVELLFGPASNMYGSDALGGAICFYTKNPILADAPGKLNTTGSVWARYGSVNSEKTVHGDISLGLNKIGSLTSFTYSDFGDLRMGEKPVGDTAFGLRNYYVERFNGKDSLVRNSDPYVQKFTGFKQYDLVQKFLFRPSARVSHVLNIQYSNSTDVPRYDRLTDPGSGGKGLNSSEWYYGPQKRLMTAYQLQINNLGWFDRLDASLSWQSIEESRHNRGFGKSSLTHRTETLSVFGLLVNARKAWGRQTLNVGLDGQFNDVTSEATQENVNDNTIKPASTRYPDGGSTLQTAALFATHSWYVNKSETVLVSEGIRAGFANLHANFKDKTFFPLPYNEAEQKNPVFSGSVGIVYNPKSSGLRVAFNAASGYRVPNVDDLAKVFESAKGSLIVPNADLKPEQSLSFDLNVGYNITDRLRWENVAWVTFMNNAIVTDVFQLNGRDSAVYDGVVSRVYANQNKREARVTGFSSTLDADLTSKLAAYASICFTKGRILAEVGEDQPLDHIPPVYGRLGLRYHASRLNAEAFTVFNGKKAKADYFLNGEDNEQYAPNGGADGMPAWYVINLRAGYRFGQNLGLQVGVDNLLDLQYRHFASGINAPGRNLFVTLRLRW